MSVRLRLFCFAALLSAAGAAAASEQWRTAHLRGECDTALAEARGAAEKGEPEAMLQMSDWHFFGTCLDKNDTESARWALLSAEAGLARARAVIEAEAPRKVPILAMTEGVIDPRVILGLNARAEDDLDARPSHHDGEDGHEHDDFNTVVIALAEIADPEVLAAAIARLAREQSILRVKGYVAVAGKPMRLLVQAVGERVRHQYDRPWGTTPRESRLVVIAEHHHIDADAIRAVLEG